MHEIALQHRKRIGTLMTLGIVRLFLDSEDAVKAKIPLNGLCPRGSSCEAALTPALREASPLKAGRSHLILLLQIRLGESEQSFL